MQTVRRVPEVKFFTLCFKETPLTLRRGTITKCAQKHFAVNYMYGLVYTIISWSYWLDLFDRGGGGSLFIVRKKQKNKLSLKIQMKTCYMHIPKVK